MREKHLELTPELYEYVLRSGARQDELLARVERETAELGSIAIMQIAPDQGALITFLVQAIGARLAVEVGTFTGYSAICIARGLPADGRLICCELDPGYAETARRNIAAGGLQDRVEISVGPALETLAALPEDLVDFAFVDADKAGYPDYYEALLARLRAGGLMMLDNVLQAGRVLTPADDDVAARTLAELNTRIAADERVDLVMLPLADGITLVRKRP